MFWPFFILQVQEGTGQASFLWPPARGWENSGSCPGAPTPCTGRDNTCTFPCFEAWASAPARPLSLGQEGNPKHQDNMRPWGGSVCVGVDISNPCERPARSIFARYVCIYRRHSGTRRAFFDLWTVVSGERAAITSSSTSCRWVERHVWSMTSSSVLSRKGWARIGYQWTLVSGDGASRGRSMDGHTHAHVSKGGRGKGSRVNIYWHSTSGERLTPTENKSERIRSGVPGKAAVLCRACTHGKQEERGKHGGRMSERASEGGTGVGCAWASVTVE